MLFWFDSFGPALTLAIGFIVVASICFHETCHVLAAHWQGDNTAIERGYLSFNPLKLMGPFSLIVFLLAGIAWGAVPVDPRRFRHRWSDLAVSLAGPASNFFLGTCFALACVLMDGNVRGNAFDPEQMSFAQNCATWGAFYNFLLGIFNLLPVPPLDGFALMRHLFPGLGRTLATQAWAQILLIVAIFVLFSGKMGGLMGKLAALLTGLLIGLFRLVV